MTDAPKHKGLYLALAAAQAEMGKALKETENAHFKKNYADLANVMDACMPALTRHGIAVMQPAYDDDTGRYVKTIFVHGESGESTECRVPLIVAKNDMQGYGSAATYARRYGLMGMAGIAPEDDDGNAAAKAPPKTEKKPDVDAETTWFNAILPTVKDADGINALLPRAKAAGRDVQQLVVHRANALGLEFDANARRYVYLEQADDSKAEREHDAAVRDQ